MKLSLFVLTTILAGASLAQAQLPTYQSFDGPDGSNWPAPWVAAGGGVFDMDLMGGRARWAGPTATVARIARPGWSEVDVDIVVTIEFENILAQGFGLYARQNGGHLQTTFPHGQGYACFIDTAVFGELSLSLWREIDGVEIPFANATIQSGVLDGTPYHVRYQVTQQGAATTSLRAKIWLAGTSEPAAWTVTATDAAPELQGVAGSLAVDVYNFNGQGHLFLDDVLVHDSLDASYCTAKQNSQGCLPQLVSSGTASSTLVAPFDVVATNVLNNKPGTMFYGFAPLALPFFGGTLCIQPPLRRTQVQFTGGSPPPEDCSGTLGLDFNALIQSGLDPGLQPGVEVFVQGWHRDNADPDGVGLSDALRFVVRP